MPVGAVRSIVIVRTWPPVLPAWSVATARIAFVPSEPGVVHSAPYGAVVSVPSEFQVPVEQATLESEHS